MTQSFLYGRVIPTIAFLSVIPATVWLLFVRLFRMGTDKLIEAQCSRQFTASIQSPCNITYTGYDPLDQNLCNFTAFFHASFTPEGLPITSFMILNLSVFTFFLFTEASRTNPHRILTSPTVWGVVFQIITMTLTIPLYWLALIFTGSTNTKSPAPITQERAESVLFGFLAGFAIPSVGMLVFQDPVVSAIWQPFPFYVALAATLHHLLRPSKPDSHSGHLMIEVCYIALFILCSSFYISLVWPLLGDWTAIQGLLLPVLRDSNLPSDPSPEFRALDFFKGDQLLGLGSCLLGALWFGQNEMEVAVIGLWAIVGTLLAGPGAAFCAVLAWRENRLGKNTALVSQKKST